MAKAYSDDFQQKVMQAIELDGLKKCEASLLFNISRNTINLWFRGEMSIHAETYAKDLMSHFQSAIASNKSVPIEVSEIYKLQTQDDPY